MTIPKRFTSMGIPFSVSLGKPLSGQMAETHLGYATVTIDKDLPKEVKEATYLHELLHIAWYQSGMDQTIKTLVIDDHTEEVIVNAMAGALYAALSGGAIGRL